MSDYHYDVLVIGTGPAGEGAAMAAVKQGMRVGAIENRGVVGGNCSHKGTIPSKALRHVVKQIIRFNQNNLFHHMGESTRVSYPKVLKSAKTVIPKQVDLHTGFL